MKLVTSAGRYSLPEEQSLFRFTPVQAHEMLVLDDS